jgi:hypothetical protein
LSYAVSLPQFWNTASGTVPAKQFRTYFALHYTSKEWEHPKKFSPLWSAGTELGKAAWPVYPSPFIQDETLRKRARSEHSHFEPFVKLRVLNNPDWNFQFTPARMLYVLSKSLPKYRSAIHFDRVACGEVVPKLADNAVALNAAFSASRTALLLAAAPEPSL